MSKDSDNQTKVQKSDKQGKTLAPINLITRKNFQQVRIGTLKPSPHNTRLHSDKQIDDIAESYRKFGMINPIIVGKNFEVIAGHGRLAAARKAGLTHVPIIIADHLSEAEMRAYRILDNRSAEHSTWDEKALAVEIAYLIEAELTCDIDFSAEITGFSSPEIDALLGKSGSDDAPSALDTMEGLTDITVVSKRGDIWKLGKHMIACGDSRDPAIYAQLLGKAKIQLVSTDPPYNVKIPGFVSGNGSVKHKDFGMASGEMTCSEFIGFLVDVFTAALERLEEGGCLYAFIDWRHVEELQAAAKKCKLTLLNICVWDKRVGGMGSFYRSQHEFVCVYRKGDIQHRNNIQLGKFGRNRTNVWSYPSANMTSEGREALKDHPTPKPVAMIADIIRDVTRPGDIVFDPFLGGGSSIIAAEKAKRRCFGIELDPKYIDVIIRRWQEFSGKDAIHVETGEPFSMSEQRTVKTRKPEKGESNGRVRER